MSKTFRTYQELIQEKQQLEALLQAQKQLLHSDIQDIRAEFAPAIAIVKKITTKDKSSLLLNIGSDMLVNGVVKNLILGRAGWLARMIIPYFVKNYSSHMVADFVGDNKKKWFQKLTSWLGHKNGKDQKRNNATEKKRDEDVF
jgi:hypothetical protein